MASINLCALTVIALIAQHMECILLRNPLAVSQAFAPPIIGTAGGTRPPHSFLPRCLTFLPALLREQNSKLVAFLQKAGIDDDAITEYLPKLVQNKVDEAALGLLIEQQLDKLAIPMGDLVKILEAAKQLAAAKRPATRRTKSRKQQDTLVSFSGVLRISLFYSGSWSAALPLWPSPRLLRNERGLLRAA
jgi:hypothetical protein